MHRDVKPGNILLERGTGRARLVDFGIAHSLAPGSESLTQTGTAPGTPRYMAPEQMAGRRVGPKGDLWSLGAVLFEALHGRPPFDGATPLAIAEQQRLGPPSLPEVDPTLAGIVRACLAFEASHRPIHAGGVAATLRSWLDGDRAETTATIAAVAVGAPAAAPALPAAPAPGPIADAPADPRAAPAGSAPPRPVASGARRRPMMTAAIAAGLAGLAVVVALAVGGLGSGLADAPPPSAQPTPTSDWIAPLLAAHLEACGQPLASNELAGMDPADAQAYVEGLIADCADDAETGEDGGDDGPGRGNGNGRGRGGGGGNGGSGNGRGNGGRGND